MGSGTVSQTNPLNDLRFMRRALELAAGGQGHVEPNPLVGCVVVQDAKIVGEGWHRRFGGPHAEVEALAAAGAAARGATLFVNLEPCSHHGKTPPCTSAILDAGIARVVVAQQDPFPAVNGAGLRCLAAAGLAVELGLAADEARALNAPFHKLISCGQPWVIAKWAMTLDGKLATRCGDSKWISNQVSRSLVHRMRGRVDAILVGRRTVEGDDPLLTARPAGPRTAVRVVLDRRASLSLQTQLVRTAREVPTLVAIGPNAPGDHCQRLENAGCQLFVADGTTHAQQLLQVLDELGRRQATNVIIEGGGQVLGAAFDAQAIDEVHVMVAPKLVGGSDAVVPLGGSGAAQIAVAAEVERLACKRLEEDVYLYGRLRAPSAQEGGRDQPRMVPHSGKDHPP